MIQTKRERKAKAIDNNLICIGRRGKEANKKIQAKNERRKET